MSTAQVITALLLACAASGAVGLKVSDEAGPFGFPPQLQQHRGAHPILTAILGLAQGQQAHHVAAPAPAPVKRLQLAPGADPCACLKWKDAYTYGARCGFSGREIKTLRKVALSPKHLGEFVAQLAPMFCHGFFEKIDDNFCMNWKYDSEDYAGDQWCYVSSECTALGAGERVNGTDVATKVCSTADQKLAAKTPPEVERIAKTEDIDLGILMRFAFPKGGEPGFPEWQDAMAASSEYPTIWEPSEDKNGAPAPGPIEVYAAGGGAVWNFDQVAHPQKVGEAFRFTCTTEC